MFKTYKYSELDSVVFEIKNNKAVIIPTDTVMGILANNENIIYQIKNRPKNKKIIKFIFNLNDLGTLTQIQKEFVNKFWPGGVTIVKNQISYRMPNDKYILYLLSKCGTLYCSSANISDQQTIIDSNHVESQFSSKKWYFDLVVVEGKPGGNLASTIIDIDNWKILREGEHLVEIQDFINNHNIHNKKFIILYDELCFGYLNAIKEIIDNEKFQLKIMPLNEKNAENLCNEILNNEYTYGVVLTQNPNKWDILFNKHYLIRSAIIYDNQISELSRLHDDANIGIFDFSLFDYDTNLENIKNFVITNFEGGRHLERVQTIIDYEKKWKN